MIRVLVVDDHDLFREMVSATLSRQGDIEVVGACADGREAVQVFCDVRPDVVLMDLSMPVLGGADATRELVAIDPGARILLLTSSPHSIEMERAVAAGAVGCVRKGAGHQELVRAITAVARPTA